jgi:RNA polymerase sigma factor (sigma-70 family)
LHVHNVEHDESPLDLVARARIGDEAAFAELVRRFERTALAIAYAVVGESSTAGDVTQEAFLRAWQRLGELTDPARFGAWLARIVRNLATDHVRRRRSRELSHDQIGEVGTSDGPRLVVDDPLEQLNRAELRQRINGTLAELDELSRSAVVLRYFEGLASKEIGELLDLSAAAVDMRLSRARAELKKKLAGVEMV